MDAITQLLTRMDADMNGAEMVAVIREAVCLQVDLMTVDELGAAIRRLRIQLQGLRDRAVPVTGSESALITQLMAMMDKDLNAAEMITTVKACAWLLPNLMTVDEAGAEIRRLYPQLQALQVRPRVEPEENNFIGLLQYTTAELALFRGVMTPEEIQEELKHRWLLLSKLKARAAPIALAEPVDVEVPEPEAVPEPDSRPAGTAVPAGTAEPEPRPPYNHHMWPSPLPRLMVLALRMTDDKRIPHARALALLANRMQCSVDVFLTKSRREVAEVLFPFNNHYGKGWHPPHGLYKLLYSY